MTRVLWRTGSIGLVVCALFTGTASAQNLDVKGTTTGEGNAFFNQNVTVAGSVSAGSLKIPGAVSGATSDLRTVAAIYNTAAAQTFTNGAATRINFGVKVLDTDNAVTTGSAWQFKVPEGKGGLYWVSATASIGIPINTPFDAFLQVWVNTTEVQRGMRLGTSTPAVANMVYLVVDSLVVVQPGNTISLTMYQWSGANRASESYSAANRVSIVRISGS